MLQCKLKECLICFRSSTVKQGIITPIKFDTLDEYTDSYLWSVAIGSNMLIKYRNVYWCIARNQGLTETLQYNIY
jgi:hypothetical protein